MRRGFTLVELLVVIAIIAIVLGFSLAALYASQESAKGARTQRTVTLLHTALMDEWEGFRTRRLAIRYGVDHLGAVINPDAKGRTQEKTTEFQFRRLEFLRQVMRIEFPDRFKDLQFTATAKATGRRNAYLRRIDSALAKYNTINSLSLTRDAYLSTAHAGQNNQSAECLYLIVTVALPPESRSVFKARDIGDTDGDQLPEILDGWGNPIEWLRWAPGFVSDLQPDANPATAVIERDAAEHHDQFDVLKTSIPPGLNPPPTESGETLRSWGFSLAPLIVSAGPDKDYGLYLLHDDTHYPKDADPYSQYKDTNGVFRWRGEAITTGDITHLDNIHNHSLGAR